MERGGSVYHIGNANYLLSLTTFDSSNANSIPEQRNIHMAVMVTRVLIYLLRIISNNNGYHATLQSILMYDEVQHAV
jgi:hypothetical protein